MALVNLIGFQDWAVGVLSSNLMPGAVNFLPIDSSLYGVATPASTFFGTHPNRITQFTDSRGVVRKGIGFGANSNASSYFRFTNAYLQPVPKTGKWYMGVRYNGQQSTTTMLSVRLSNNAATTWAPSAGISNTTLYFEVAVDWVAKTFDMYVNKVKVGSGVADPASTPTNWLITFGMTSTQVQEFSFTDIYWVVEDANEPQPLPGPLGPIFVQRAPIASVSNAELFTPPASLSVGDQWNANSVTPAYSGTTNVANGVNTSPHGEAAEVHFTQPTETAPILAVAWNLATFKTQVANAGTASQVVDGSNSLPQTKEIPAVTSNSNVNQHGSTVALDGTAWTKEAVARTVLKVGSYRP